MAQLSAVAESARRCARSADRSRCNGRGGSAGISHRRACPFAAGAGKRLDSMTAIRNINATATTARTVRPTAPPAISVTPQFVFGWIHRQRWQRLPEMERLGDFLFRHIEGIAAYSDQ